MEASLSGAECGSAVGWLRQAVPHVAMESTGSYWKPVFNVLEESLTVVLANRSV